MELKLNDKEFKSNFNKLLKGLIDGTDLNFFTVDKETKTVCILFGDWNVELKNDGTWEIG